MLQKTHCTPEPSCQVVQMYEMVLKGFMRTTLSTFINFPDSHYLWPQTSIIYYSSDWQPFYSNQSSQPTSADIPVKNWSILLKQFYRLHALANGNTIEDAVHDGRLCSQCCHLRWTGQNNVVSRPTGAATWQTVRDIHVVFDSGPFTPLGKNVMLSTKLEVHNIWHSLQKRTKLWIQVSCTKNLMQRDVVF